ncbi:hypothetical protein M431DRAFT_345027 [Trichoderma harzianum CBS 226.95]|uniref:Uncharacterized protein n=1 Tax=Trichoderma harzianum CBS 226.95 TaxID=983964 RepID=A0A2T4AKP6_TRIHA|nr:hypothetical protein M431DRAFT_345027 [Trichoderma harzianum CBS 226.95]PTB57602.1 hypothetical protein M431DRAFT_345027 [Trichoderma harzianum CBS 226.95]
MRLRYHVASDGSNQQCTEQASEQPFDFYQGDPGHKQMGPGTSNTLYPVHAAILFVGTNKTEQLAGHVVSQAFYDRKGQKMEGERKTAKNVRDEMSRGRVMDEILVREPATGKLRGPFFPVCLFLSGLSLSLISSWSDLRFFGTDDGARNMGSAIRQQIQRRACTCTCTRSGRWTPGSGQSAVRACQLYLCSRSLLVTELVP